MSGSPYVRVRSPLLRPADGSPVPPLLELPLAGDEPPHSLMAPQGGLRARHVAAFAFAMTCSGPFGLEDCIQTAGPWWTLLGFLVVSVVYVLPQILMTSELSMTLPLSNGGIVSWASRAFGPRAASFVALNMLVYQLVDLATYPTLVTGYALSAGYSVSDWMAVSAPLAVVMLGFCMNLLNIEVAGEVYTWLLMFILLPFLVGVPCAIPHLPAAWAELTGRTPATLRPPSMDINLFVSTLFWLNTGWDSMGNLASEVAGPRDLVRGLTMAAVFTWALYSLCMFAALGGGPGEWSGGYLAVAYGRYLSPLGPWICICAGLANSLLYTSEVTTVTRLIQSMGDPQDELHLLPSCFARQLHSKAPVVALLVVTATECALARLTFDYLVQLSTLLHVVAFWASLAVYVKLHLLRPDIPRLYTVPGGRWGCFGIVALKAPVLVFLTVSAFTKPSVVLGGLGANGAFMACIGLWACCEKRPRPRQVACDAVAPTAARER